MGYVALGAVAFVMAGFFDFASLKRIPYMKQSIGVTVVLLFGYSLGRMFGGYEQYRKETAMLIPTRASIVRCWHSLRSEEEEKAE